MGCHFERKKKKEKSSTDNESADIDDPTWFVANSYTLGSS